MVDGRPRRARSGGGGSFRRILARWCSSWCRGLDGADAQCAFAERLGGLVRCHPPGPDLLSGGVPHSHDGGGEPGRVKPAVEAACALAAADQALQPREECFMWVMAVLSHRLRQGWVEQEREVLAAELPAGVEEAGERVGWRAGVQVVDGGEGFGSGVVEHRVDEGLTRGE